MNIIFINQEIPVKACVVNFAIPIIYVKLRKFVRFAL